MVFPNGTLQEERYLWCYAVLKCSSNIVFIFSEGFSRRTQGGIKTKPLGSRASNPSNWHTLSRSQTEGSDRAGRGGYVLLRSLEGCFRPKKEVKIQILFVFLLHCSQQGLSSGSKGESSLKAPDTDTLPLPPPGSFTPPAPWGLTVRM